MKASRKNSFTPLLLSNFMFKRFILALVCLSFTISGFAAKLTATLQSGDKVTPFYGGNAFVEAYNAAVNGDIITLSPGEFYATNIEKSITVIGTYAFSDDLSRATQFPASITISADDVTLEGIIFSKPNYANELIIKGADNLTINRCRINYLKEVEKEGHKYHSNTILTDCYIYEYCAMSLSKNAVLRNCSVSYFANINEIGNPALIESCNVTHFAHYSTSLSSTYKRPYAIYRNCWLGLYKTSSSTDTPSLSFSAPSEFHNNMFFCSYQNSPGSNYAQSWTIRYGSAANSGNVRNSVYISQSYYPVDGSFSPITKDGMSYGPIDHKSYPAIPSITSSEIDTKTDANGNLHVKITATARD